jgi:hypothetical protein
MSGRHTHRLKQLNVALVASHPLIPRKTQDEMCYFPRGHTAIWLAATAVVCVLPPACLRHARSSQTHTKTALSVPLDTPVIHPRRQQSSLILPVFTNWPSSCSSDPDSGAFVCTALCNSSKGAKVALHCNYCTHNTCRRAQQHLKQQPADCSPAIENQRRQPISSAVTATWPLALHSHVTGQTHPFEDPTIASERSRNPINHPQAALNQFSSAHLPHLDEGLSTQGTNYPRTTCTLR